MFAMYVFWGLVGIFAVVGGFVSFAYVCKAIDYAIQFAIMKIKFHGDYDAYCKWAEVNYW